MSFLPGLLWGVPFVSLPPFMPDRPDIADQPIDETTPLTVIIPARNEALTITTLLESLLASTHRNLEIVVVDDRSTDNTAQLVRGVAKSDSRVTLLEGEPLPSGWLGKPWAAHQGARIATGEVLLFTDADTTHAPQLASRALGAMRASDADLLTLTSRQLCLTFWERVVMPQVWMLLGIRYHPIRLNRARQLWDVAANGQFIMVEHESYTAVGGHEAVHDLIVEDIGLAQVFFSRGLRVRMMFGESLLETRMYRSLAEMVEGWSKNLYLGARLSAGKSGLMRTMAPIGMLAAFLFWLVPPILLAVGILVPAMTLAVVLSVLFWTRLSHRMKIPLLYGVAYPLGAAMMVWIGLRSVLRGGRHVEWRGRTYRLSE